MNTPYKMKGPSLLKMVSALKSKPTKDKVKKTKPTKDKVVEQAVTSEKMKKVNRTQNTSKESTLTGMVGGKKVTLNSEQLKNIGVE